jgi:hypothetical protein
MKIRYQNTARSHHPHRRWLALAITLLALPSARGYYDPSTQRWINRDPITEIGFERRAQPASTPKSPAATESGTVKDVGANPFSFCDNAPTIKLDPDGRGIFSFCKNLPNLFYVTPACWQAQQQYQDTIKRLDSKYGQGNWPEPVQKAMDKYKQDLLKDLPSCIDPIIKGVPGSSGTGPVVTPR